jgi:hypothetical protein
MTNFSSSTAGTPAVGATGAGGADGIDVTTDSGTGVLSLSASGTAVNAESESGTAIAALSGTANGVLAWSEDVAAVYAWNGPKDLSAGYPQEAAVHAFSAGTVASTSTATTGPGTQTAMFAEGGVGYGLLATAGPSEAQLTSTYPNPVVWSDIGTAIRAQNFYGTAIQAMSAYGAAINASITSEKFVSPAAPPGVTPPPPGICILAFNAHPQLAISAVTMDAEGNASDCIRGVTSYGVGVNGQSQYGTGVMGTTQSIAGTGVTADGGTNPGGSPIGAVALKVQNGTIAVTSDSVGTTILHHGTKTVTVSNPAATPHSLIFLTPQEDPQGFLWISAHTAGSFTIKASAAPSADVTIGFLIIN